MPISGRCGAGTAGPCHKRCITSDSSANHENTPAPRNSQPQSACPSAPIAAALVKFPATVGK